MSIAALIDHTLLAPDVTAQHIRTLCREAVDHGFATVCVSPTRVRLAADELAGHAPRVGDDQANVMAVVAKLPNPCNDLTGEVRIDGRRRDIDTVTDDVGSVFRDDWHALQVRAEHRR